MNSDGAVDISDCAASDCGFFIAIPDRSIVLEFACLLFGVIIQ